MTEPEAVALAAAQADARRAAAEARLAENPPVVESVTDLLRERLGRQVARRAEQRGQLDVSGQ